MCEASTSGPETQSSKPVNVAGVLRQWQTSTLKMGQDLFLSLGSHIYEESQRAPNPPWTTAPVHNTGLGLVHKIEWKHRWSYLHIYFKCIDNCNQIRKSNNCFCILNCRTYINKSHSTCPRALFSKENIIPRLWAFCRLGLVFTVLPPCKYTECHHDVVDTSNIAHLATGGDFFSPHFYLKFFMKTFSGYWARSTNTWKTSL